MDQDRDVILATLRRVRNRIRFSRGLQDFAFVFFLALASLVAFQLIRLLVPIPAILDTHLPRLWLVALGVFLLWRLTRTRSLAQAAAFADGKGDLKDELKTAYWFIEEGDEAGSPWTDLQARRAATTATELDLTRLVPTHIPKQLFLADGALLAMGLFLWTLPGQPSMVSPDGARDLTREEEKQAQDIRELIADAGRTETAQELDEALERLEQGELPLAEGLQGLAIVENLLSEGNLEMSTIKEGLGELAQDFRASSELTAVAEAMESSDLDEASDLLRALAQNLPEAPANMAALHEALEKASQVEAPLEELLENLRQAAEALARQDSDEAQRSLEEAANELEALGRKMEAQNQMNDARRQLGELRQSLGQQFPFGASDEQSGPPSDSSDAGEGESAPAEAGGMAMPGGDVQLQMGGGAAPDPTNVLDAGPGGHSTGPSQGEDNVRGEPTRLDVQLEMEMLAAEEQERPTPEDIFDKESRQEHSLVDYRETSPRSDYADEAVMNEERIPWRYRSLVKKYFLALRSQQAQPEDNN